MAMLLEMREEWWCPSLGTVAQGFLTQILCSTRDTNHIHNPFIMVLRTRRSTKGEQLA